MRIGNTKYIIEMRNRVEEIQEDGMVLRLICMLVNRRDMDEG